MSLLEDGKEKSEGRKKTKPQDSLLPILSHATTETYKRSKFGDKTQLRPITHRKHSSLSFMGTFNNQFKSLQLNVPTVENETDSNGSQEQFNKL